jgi:Skp family chaperone for outer membrane proteins
MGSIFKFALFLLVLLSASLSNHGVYAAEQTRNIKMGILDVEWVTSQSLMKKDTAQQIDTKRRKFMTEIKKEETSLRKSDEELQKQRVILSPQAYAEELRKFRLKTRSLRQKVQVRNQELSQMRSLANRALERAIQKALTEVTKRERYNLVLRYSPQIILVRPTYLDISKLVLGQLNKNVSKFTIPAAPIKTGK